MAQTITILNTTSGNVIARLIFETNFEIMLDTAESITDILQHAYEDPDVELKVEDFS